METLTIIAYLLNGVFSKPVLKTPFELWTVKKPNLRNLHVWGCQAEVKIYNSRKKKLDSRTTSGYFIGYSEKSKMYKFYSLNHSLRIVEFENARFVKNGEISGSMEPRKEKIQEDRVQVPLHVTSSKVVFPMVIERINNF